MATFQVGHMYAAHSACNWDCVYVIKIVKRTAKMVVYQRDGEERRTKLFSDERGEYIVPERYSMAPVFRADAEYFSEDSERSRETEEPIEEASPEPSNIITIAQPADNGEIVVMLGQRVERNCGAMCPIERGVIVGFRESSRSPKGEVVVLVRWSGTANHIETVRLADIHRAGWRSLNGSPLGIFVVE